MLEVEQDNRPCDVTLLSDWERELWQRYGRIIFPQTAEGQRIYSQQRKQSDGWGK
jgi:hypothetical protein